MTRSKRVFYGTKGENLLFLAQFFWCGKVLEMVFLMVSEQLSAWYLKLGESRFRSINQHENPYSESLRSRAFG
jgi:hypothetical protein